MLILGPFSIYKQPKQAGGLRLGYSPYLYFGCSYIESALFFVFNIEMILMRVQYYPCMCQKVSNCHLKDSLMFQENSKEMNV